MKIEIAKMRFAQYWDGFQQLKNSEPEIANIYSSKYWELKKFCLEIDALSIEDFREIEKHIK